MTDILEIDVGTGPGDGNGEDAYSGFTKCNTNFATLASTSFPSVSTVGANLSGVSSDNDSTLSLSGSAAATGLIAAGMRISQTYRPNGPLNVNGIQLLLHLGTANGNNIANYEGVFVASMGINADYLGSTPAVTQFEACNVWTDLRTGGTAVNPCPTFRGFQADPITNAIACTASGAVTNWQFFADGGISNAAATGVTITNVGYRCSLASGGSTAVGGLTQNYGIQITGNGGTNVAGTTTNRAILSTSTAQSEVQGGFDNTPIGVTTPAAGNFTTLQIALTTPASSAAAGTAGQMTADASFIYVCTATNTWKRAALSTF